MRPRTAALALALCCVLAGCTGGGGTTATPSDGASPGDTPERPDGPIITYSSLSPTEQTAFDVAVADGVVVFGPDSPALDTDAPLAAKEAFHDGVYVERNGTYYEPTIESRGFVASYNIMTEPVNASANVTTVPFENVTGAHTEELRKALENGSHTLPPGTTSSLSLSLNSGDHVEYRNTTYRVLTVVGDIRPYEMTVEEF